MGVPTEDEIQKHVKRLLDLKEGLRHFSEVVRLGKRAIPALEQALRGPSESIYEPRCLVADALGGIGGPEAVDALLRAILDSEDRKLDAVFHEAEFAVINRIAENLGKLGDLRVVETLLSLLQRHPYSGCLRALSRLNEVKVIPLAVKWLRDDFARDASMEVIREWGFEAVPALVSFLRETSGKTDSPSVRVSRGIAARLAGEVGDPTVIMSLAICLYDEFPIVRLGAAIGLTFLNNKDAIEAALPTLLGFLSDEDIFRVNEVSDALLRVASISEPYLVEIIQQSLRSNLISQMQLQKASRAIEILGRIGSDGAIQAVSELSAHSDEFLRFQAIQILGRSEKEGVAVHLSKFLADPSLRNQESVVKYLGSKSSPGAGVLVKALLLSHFRMKRKIRKMIIQMGLDALPSINDALELLNHYHHRCRIWIMHWRLKRIKNEIEKSKNRKSGS